MDINILVEENKQLKDEIKRLKKILDEYHITYEKPRYIPKKKKYSREGAIILHSFFKGREDVYAKRVEGKMGQTIIHSVRISISLIVLVI